VTMVTTMFLVTVSVVVRQLTARSIKGWLVGLDALVALGTLVSITLADLLKGSGAVATSVSFTEEIVVSCGATGGLQRISVANNTLEAVVVLASVGSTVPSESSLAVVSLVARSTVGMKILSSASGGSHIGVVSEKALVASCTLTLLHGAESSHGLVASHGGWWVGDASLVAELFLTEKVATVVTEHSSVHVSAVHASCSLMLETSTGLGEG